MGAGGNCLKGPLTSAPGLQAQAADLRTHFLDAMSHMACSVCIVTTDGPAGRAGMTVSSMTPVSADGAAPSLCVCLHHDALARSAVQQNGNFCVNLLRADQSAVADLFAGRTAAAEDARFDAVDWRATPAGGPRIAGALASFDCKLEHSFKYQTHHLLVGSVGGIELGRPGPALIYANRAYGLPEPLNADSKD